MAVDNKKEVFTECPKCGSQVIEMVWDEYDRRIWVCARCGKERSRHTRYCAWS